MQSVIFQADSFLLYGIAVAEIHDHTEADFKVSWKSRWSYWINRWSFLLIFILNYCDSCLRTKEGLQIVYVHYYVTGCFGMAENILNYGFQRFKRMYLVHAPRWRCFEMNSSLEFVEHLFHVPVKAGDIPDQNKKVARYMWTNRWSTPGVRNYYSPVTFHWKMGAFDASARITGTVTTSDSADEEKRFNLWLVGGIFLMAVNIESRIATITLKYA